MHGPGCISTLHTPTPVCWGDHVQPPFPLFCHELSTIYSAAVRDRVKLTNINLYERAELSSLYTPQERLGQDGILNHTLHAIICSCKNSSSQWVNPVQGQGLDPTHAEATWKAFICPQEITLTETAQLYSNQDSCRYGEGRLYDPFPAPGQG